MGWVCGTYERRERCIQVFGARPEVNRPLGRPRNRLEDNIKMNPHKVEWEHRLD
jgi:hypothetical protein